MNYNIYNEHRITEWIDAMLVDQLLSENMRTWFYTIFKRWARRQESMMRIAMPEGMLSSTLLKEFVKDRLEGRLAPTASSILNVALFDFIKPPQEEWAIRAMAAGQLYTFHPTLSITRSVPHWIDFMRTLPNRPIRYSVESLMKAVDRWDEEMLRVKTLIDSTEGVTEVWSDGDHYVVRLDSKESVKAEGALMGHCVWTQRYDLHRGTLLFSLRHRGQPRPLATMEVNEPAPALKLKDLAAAYPGQIPESLLNNGGISERMTNIMLGVAANIMDRIHPDMVKGEFQIPLELEHVPVGKPVLKQVCTVRNRAIPADILNLACKWFTEKYPTCEVSPQVLVEGAAAGVYAVEIRNPNDRPGPIRALLERQVREQHVANTERLVRMNGNGLIPLPAVWTPVSEVPDLRDRHLRALGIHSDLLSAGFSARFDENTEIQQSPNTDH